MDNIKKTINESFEEKVESLNETINSLEEIRWDFEEKIEKLKSQLEFIEDSLVVLEK